MNTNNTHHTIPASHFNKKTLRALTKKGIAIINAQWMPGRDGSYISADAQTGYMLDDNGTGRLVTYLEVLKLAA
jgi:hypothetical protein